MFTYCFCSVFGPQSSVISLNPSPISTILGVLPPISDPMSNSETMFVLLSAKNCKFVFIIRTLFFMIFILLLLIKISKLHIYRIICMFLVLSERKRRRCAVDCFQRHMLVFKFDSTILQPSGNIFQHCLCINRSLVRCRRAAEHDLKRHLCGITSTDVFFQIDRTLQWEDADRHIFINAIPFNCSIVCFEHPRKTRILQHQCMNRFLRTLCISDRQFFCFCHLHASYFKMRKNIFVLINGCYLIAIIIVILHPLKCPILRQSCTGAISLYKEILCRYESKILLLFFLCQCRPCFWFYIRFFQSCKIDIELYCVCAVHSAFGNICSLGFHKVYTIKQCPVILLFLGVRIHPIVEECDFLVIEESHITPPHIIIRCRTGIRIPCHNTTGSALPYPQAPYQ
nr:MAG TPA: hypothetical protein [Caudoviricetes sp.]